MGMCISSKEASSGLFRSYNHYSYHFFVKYWGEYFPRLSNNHYLTYNLIEQKSLLKKMNEDLKGLLKNFRDKENITTIFFDKKEYTLNVRQEYDFSIATLVDIYNIFLKTEQKNGIVYYIDTTIFEENWLAKNIVYLLRDENRGINTKQLHDTLKYLNKNVPLPDFTIGDCEDAISVLIKYDYMTGGNSNKLTNLGNLLY